MSASNCSLLSSLNLNLFSAALHLLTPQRRPLYVV
jgi:hypothetical protein